MKQIPKNYKANQLKNKKKYKKAKFRRNIAKFFTISLASFLLLFFGTFAYFNYTTPKIDLLKDNKLSKPLQIYSADGKLLLEYGDKREPVKFNQIPSKLIQAFIVAEDRNFFYHFGVDVTGIFRALFEWLTTGHKQSGGSTITMQVARNYFLTNEKTIIRKIKEIFLALKIERELNKKEIFELYLNKIFLGHKSFGVVAAARTYYNKGLKDLTIAQMAMLASLPKGPSSLNPISNPERARQRRNWVLAGMLQLNYIDLVEYQKAINEPITESINKTGMLNSEYIGEMVRQKLLGDSLFSNLINSQNIYTEGYKVYTTIDSNLQKHADISVKKGIINYMKREKYLGVLEHHDDILSLPTAEKYTAIKKLLENDERKFDRIGLKKALVYKIIDNNIFLYDRKGNSIEVNQLGFQWILENNELEDIASIIRKGDVILIQDDNNIWKIAQEPTKLINGALVSLNPNSGEIISLVGGIDYFISKYNNATQAERQLGSTIKPFIYTIAFENGFTPATFINDSPFVENYQSNDIWRPSNSSGSFLGSIRLRKALFLSRNVVTIKLANNLGLNKIRTRLEDFGFDKKLMPKDLSLALGTMTTTPMNLAKSFSMFANGGYKISPFLIKKLENGKGDIIYERKTIYKCSDCIGIENITDKPLISKGVHYIIDSVLIDIVKRGTGRRALVLNRNDLRGKTGTTNNYTDAWFAGYNRSITTVAWIGNLDSSPMLNNSYGANTALPVWIDYMEYALKGLPEIKFIMPEEEVVKLKIDKDKNLLISNDGEGYNEYFIIGTEPTLKKKDDYFYNNKESDDKKAETPEQILF